jgi:hypothetical protein
MSSITYAYIWPFQIGTLVGERPHRSLLSQTALAAGDAMLFGRRPQRSSLTSSATGAAQLSAKRAPRRSLLSGAPSTSALLLAHKPRSSYLDASSGMIPMIARVYGVRTRPAAVMPSFSTAVGWINGRRTQRSFLWGGSPTAAVLRGRHGRHLSYLYAPDPVQRNGVLVPAFPLAGSDIGAAEIAVTTVNAAFADRFAAADGFEAVFTHILADLIEFTDQYRQSLNVIAALNEGMSFRDIALMLIRGNLVDEFIASGVLSNTAQVTLLLRDTFNALDNPNSVAAVLAALSDSFYATISFNTGSDVYTAWVMTPETKAMRSYTNFPFNSYAVVDGALWGACATGIYRMGGTTDAGASIQSAIRTGLLDFGTRRLKRIDRAYIGYTSNGALALRVVATSHLGEKIEYTYAMTQRDAASPRENRIEIGRGTRSVYWSFELINTGGDTFELFDMTVLPMALTGRVH